MQFQSLCTQHEPEFTPLAAATGKPTLPMGQKVQQLTSFEKIAELNAVANELHAAAMELHAEVREDSVPVETVATTREPEGTSIGGLDDFAQVLTLHTEEATKVDTEATRELVATIVEVVSVATQEPAQTPVARKQRIQNTPYAPVNFGCEERVPPQLLRSEAQLCLVPSPVAWNPYSPQHIAVWENVEVYACVPRTNTDARLVLRSMTSKQVRSWRRAHDATRVRKPKPAVPVCEYNPRELALYKFAISNHANTHEEAVSAVAETIAQTPAAVVDVYENLADQAPVKPLNKKQLRANLRAANHKKPTQPEDVSSRLVDFDEAALPATAESAKIPEDRCVIPTKGLCPTRLAHNVP